MGRFLVNLICMIVYILCFMPVFAQGHRTTRKLQLVDIELLHSYQNKRSRWNIMVGYISILYLAKFFSEILSLDKTVSFLILLKKDNVDLKVHVNWVFFPNRIR